MKASEHRSRSARLWLRKHRAALLSGAWRVVLLALLTVVVLQTVSPATYRIEQGYVTFRFDPVRPDRSGRVIMPLGPVGVLHLDTHRTPVDLEVDFRLGDQLPTVAEARDLLRGDSVERDAVNAFDRFALTRVPWILAAGMLAGLLVAGGSGRRAAEEGDRGAGARRSLSAAGLGVLAAALGLAVFVGATVATLDRSPAIDYQGLATNAPRVLDLVARFERDAVTSESSVRDFVRGLEQVALQLEQADGSVSRDVTRVLALGDVHDNVIGLRLASSLATSETGPADAVVLAGDITQRGTQAEGALVVSQLDVDDTPVIVVGGNHEDGPALERFGEAGYQVLDSATTAVAGVTLYGVVDPQADTLEATPDEAALEEQAAALLETWRAMPARPDVLVVHDVAQAEPVIEWARQEGEPLTVVHGHTHDPSVTRQGSVTVVDTGTGGASGYESVGRDPEAMYTFQMLEFSRERPTRLLAVVTFGYAGLTGPSTVRYEPIAR